MITEFGFKIFFQKNERSTENIFFQLYNDGDVCLELKQLYVNIHENSN